MELVGFLGAFTASSAKSSATTGRPYGPKKASDGAFLGQGPLPVLASGLSASARARSNAVLGPQISKQRRQWVL